MKKALFAGVCALALSATGALAQANNESNNPTAKPGMMKNDGMKHSGTSNTGTTGMSNQGMGKDSNVPGSKNAGGTSDSSPNTVKPGASDKGGR